MASTLPYCKCGCGKKVTKISNKYLVGHYKKKYNKPWNKGKKFNRKTRKKMSESAVKKFEAHPELKEKCVSNRLTLKRIEKEYQFLTEVEEIQEEKEKILVKCKYCQRSFQPTYTQIYERIRALREKNGLINNFFYCSPECKTSCRFYNRHTDPDQLDKLNEYRMLVYRETAKTLRKYKVKNLNLRGKNYELDHKFSIYEGFLKGITPEIIGSFHNLEILTKKENLKKSAKCSISLQELINLIKEKNMEFNEYQKLCGETAVYPVVGSNYVYPALGLAGETGEVMEKIKKAVRDHDGEINTERQEALKKELGDVMWNVAMLCTELQLELESVAESNIEKLRDRLKRNVVKGDGDNR